MRRCAPSTHASATRPVMSLIERIASSLPGMTKSTESGSQLVSVMAMIGNAELARFADRDLLLVRIDDEDRVGQRAHALQAAQVLLEALALFLEARDFLLGELHVGAVVLHALERAKAIEALLDGAEVGERAAEPAVGHEVHPGALCLFDDDVLRLALGADEQDVTAATDRLDDEVVGALEQARGLVEVDDVDAVARAVDEGAHLRVPALGLVTEVNAGFDERAERERAARPGAVGAITGLRGCYFSGDFRHGRAPFRLFPPPFPSNQPLSRESGTGPEGCARLKGVWSFGTLAEYGQGPRLGVRTAKGTRHARESRNHLARSQT